MSQSLPTTAEIIRTLQSQPGIDIRKQKRGTKIVVETETEVYELTIVFPEEGVVRVWGTDARLRQPCLGVFKCSTYALDPRARIDNWIGRTMRMVIGFRTTLFESDVVVSAAVEGASWSYNVF